MQASTVQSPQIKQSYYKLEGHFFRTGRRIAPKFGTHVPIETRLALSKTNLTHPTPGGGVGQCNFVTALVLTLASLHYPCGGRRTAPHPNLARMCG